MVLAAGIFNNQFSWDKQLNERDRPDFGATNLHIYPSPEDTLKMNVDRKEKDIIGQMYLERHYINVPILGFRFSVNDVSIMGSIALCILVTLFFFSNRREYWINHEIFETFRFIEKNMKDDAQNIKNKKVNKLFMLEYIFHGCLQNHLFTTSTSDDFLPYRTKVKVENLRTISYKTNKSGRRFMRILYILPIMTMLFIILVDMYSLKKGWTPIFSVQDAWIVAIQIGIRFFISILALIYCCFQVYKSMCVFKRSKQVLNYMYEKTKIMQDDLEQLEIANQESINADDEDPSV